jgi:Kdo2-lipid IVA lauroyltransferase/acyltransferase
MEAAVFYLFYITNWIITLLPLKVLYIFSDIFYLFIYYFPGYRRSVVHTNLRNAFPEKSEQEIAKIEKSFYKHLAGIFVETLKLTHMSIKQLTSRLRVENSELLTRLKAEKRDIVAICGHYNNWEWMTIVPLFTDYKCISIYKPLQNKYFDKFVNDLRKKHGFFLTPMSGIIRELINDRNAGINTLSAFIADQTPAKGDINYWTQFLNQESPVFLGAEKIASKYDAAVLLFNNQKIKRGYYTIRIELLFEHTAGLTDHVITESHVRRLEEIIKEKPQYWIWSHRRWKYKKEQPDG